MAIIDTSGLEPFADLLKEIYGDLAKPGVAQVGIALATVIGLLNTCLSPIKFLNEKTELNRQNNLKQLAKRFSEIPTENIVEAPPEIAVPIAEKLAYVSNEDIRNMYIELLAKASSINLNEKAHPSFVNIINNLSPDEAKLISYLKEIGGIPFVNIMRKSIDHTVLHIDPLVCLIPELQLTFTNNLKAYLSNLEAAGLIIIDSNVWATNDGAYEAHKEYLTSKIPYYDERYKDEPMDKTPSPVYTFNKGIVRITDFGTLFFSAVI